MSLTLAVCYAAVAALLLNLNLASGWSTRVKFGAIGLVSLLYAGTWIGINGLVGWPTEEAMPDHFQLQWVTIDEPGSQGEPGAIYYWVRAFGDGAGRERPRAHALPFDEANSEAAREALNLLQEGKRVEGRITKQLIKPKREASDGPSEPDDGRRPGDGPQDRPRFEFREMPPPDLPAKPPL